MLTKEIIKKRIAQNKLKLAQFGVDLIGLYGSYVREEQNNNSDIDLLVSFEDGKETFHNFMDLSSFVDRMFQGEKVEIVTKNGLSPYIGPKILKEVEYVQVTK